MKTFKQIILEAYQNNFKGKHGPLMKAGNWIGKQSLEKLANHPEINEKRGHTTIYSGELRSNWNSKAKPKKVALLNHDEPNESNFKHGYNKPHDWYEDTGMGNKNHHNTHLVVTGHAHIHPDGKVTYHGNADPKESHNLMVYH